MDLDSDSKIYFISPDMESTQYDQFNDAGQKCIPQRGMRAKVMYLIYGVLVFLLLIQLLVTGLKFSQLNQDLVDVKRSIESLDKSVRSAQTNSAGSSAWKVVEPLTGSCDDGWQHFQSSCYLFSNVETDWNEAEKLCLSHASHLAILDSADELKYISDVADGLEFTLPYWIGLVEKQEEGRWTWVDGTDFLTTNLWDIGQPDDWDYRDNGEDCGQLHSPHRPYHLRLLNDADCSRKYRYICERRSI